MQVALFLRNPNNGDDDRRQLDLIDQLIADYQLPIRLLPIFSEHSKQARINPQVPILFTKNQQLHLYNDGITLALNWHKIASRLVKAGQKTELLLKACKLNAAMRAFDATAGLGQDGLLLAATGARVVMAEQNPLIFLLLACEKDRMNAYPNWQKLLARVQLRFGDSLTLLQKMPLSNDGIGCKAKFDVIYLDLMFPVGSYKAKVGKAMQLLHTLAAPPDMATERALLNAACVASRRVVVKRPNGAPFLANLPANESWKNSAVRFDGYFTG